MWSKNFCTFRAITSITAIFELSLVPVHAYHLKAQTINSSVKFIPDDIIRLLTFDTFSKWVLSVKFLLNCTLQLNEKFFFVGKRGIAFFQLSPVHLFPRFSRLGERSQLLLAGSTRAIFRLCDSFRLISGRRSAVSLHRLGVMQGYSSRGNILFRLTLYLFSVSAFLNFSDMKTELSVKLATTI